jgi:vacuolar-type H+-ATPase subunit D/Vma8
VDLAAARALDAAVSTTRRQIRVLRRHWIPRLREALVQLEFALEQSDFEDGTRRRLAR